MYIVPFHRPSGLQANFLNSPLTSPTEWKLAGIFNDDTKTYFCYSHGTVAKELYYSRSRSQMCQNGTNNTSALIVYVTVNANKLYLHSRATMGLISGNPNIRNPLPVLLGDKASFAMFLQLKSSSVLRDEMSRWRILMKKSCRNARLYYHLNQATIILLNFLPWF